jgi:triosephosphate isomerase
MVNQAQVRTSGVSARPARKLIAGNWKMNGSLAANDALLSAVLGDLSREAPACDVVVCAPMPYLAQVASMIGTHGTITLGAQDVSAHPQGAYTGETSAGMLRDVGVSLVLVGHSERRQYHGETDAVVAAKAHVALQSGLRPVVCLGETLEEREADKTAAVVERQLGVVLQALGAAAGGLIVAYEPIWAIGTGRTATPEQAQAVHASLRAQIDEVHAVRDNPATLLYGGSMNAANAADLLAQPDIDGGLIGGASLKATDFLSIIRAAGRAGAATLLAGASST